jgi:hypothetical protein
MTKPEHVTWNNIPFIKRNELQDPGGDFATLVHAILQMEIYWKYLRGNIAVIGDHAAFPERCLVCTPESYFRQLRQNISTLAYLRFERSNASPGPLLAGNTRIVSDPTIEEIQKLPSRVVAYYPMAGLEYTLRNQLPASHFHAILELESHELDTEIRSGLIAYICSKLQPGGVFIGSGNIDEEDYQNLQKNIFPGIHIIQAIHLSDLYGHPFRNHTGIILQKQ